jgi:hypothetical protein
MCETERETAPPPGEMIALLDGRCRDVFPQGAAGAGTSTISVTYDDGVTAGDPLTAGGCAMPCSWPRGHGPRLGVASGYPDVVRRTTRVGTG